MKPNSPRPRPLSQADRAAALGITVRQLRRDESRGCPRDLPGAVRWRMLNIRPKLSMATTEQIDDADRNAIAEMYSAVVADLVSALASVAALCRDELKLPERTTSTILGFVVLMQLGVIEQITGVEPTPAFRDGFIEWLRKPFRPFPGTVRE
ncbi:MAG: hypothetical protein ACM3SS_15975 [Rhodospirillaceae bacterium]